jgi:2,4'-dihydroxyacetophenone dioxygenase
MPDMATTEFWKDIKPIENVFKAGALPEMYRPNASGGDERYWVPFTETVSSKPLWISPRQNKWCDVLMAKQAGLVTRHYHPHEVLAYTISGKWGYLEHDWTGTAGDFIYEAPGEAHTLVAYDSPEPMKVLFVVSAPLIWLGDNGETTGYYDVHDYIDMCRAHYDKVGIGAAFVETLFR